MNGASPWAQSDVDNVNALGASRDPAEIDWINGAYRAEANKLPDSMAEGAE